MNQPKEKIKHCIHCEAAEDTAKLWKLKCKNRNMLGTIINRHVFKTLKK